MINIYTSNFSQKWVEQEKEHFKVDLDKDQDGALDQEEVQQWIRPDGRTPLDFATDHLLHSSDQDRDGRLSIQEVVDNYHTFFKSQATDWGQLLLHDEL